MALNKRGVAVVVACFVFLVLWVILIAIEYGTEQTGNAIFAAFTWTTFVMFFILSIVSCIACCNCCTLNNPFIEPGSGTTIGAPTTAMATTTV